MTLYNLPPLIYDLLALLSPIAIGLIINEIHEKRPIRKLFTLIPPLPLSFVECQKKSRYEKLTTIKNNRHDERHYLYELQKTQNWFIVLVVTAVVNFIFLLSINLLEHHFSLFVLGMMPTYIVELIWLSHISYVKDLTIYQKGNLEWKKCKQRKIKNRNS